MFLGAIEQRKRIEAFCIHPFIAVIVAVDLGFSESFFYTTNCEQDAL